MFCSKCGKQIDDDSRFCPFCGNTAEGSPVPKAPGGLGKSREQAAGRQRAERPLPVKLIAGGVAAAVVPLIVSIIIFRPTGKIENSFLGRMFSLSWSNISGMSARDFKKLLKEKDISCGYEEGSGWNLNTKGRTLGFMGGDACYRVEFDSDGKYMQHFLILYETREDCSDSYEGIRKYLDNGYWGAL